MLTADSPTVIVVLILAAAAVAFWRLLAKLLLVSVVFLVLLGGASLAGDLQDFDSLGPAAGASTALHPASTPARSL